MKKSFVLHCDSLRIINKLSDEQAGKLLRKMLSYHDETDYDCDEFVIDVAFEQFKNQFDRDSEKYKKVCERNRVNGQKGGRTQKNPVGLSGTQKNPVGLSGTQKNPSKPKKPDNDNDNDNDNVSDNDKGLIISTNVDTSLKAGNKKKVSIEIDEIINLFKSKCDDLGFEYDSKSDRSFAKHILSKKFGDFCEKHGKSRGQMIDGIMTISSEFRRGPLSGPKKFYQMYIECINDFKSRSKKEQKKKIYHFDAA